MSRKTMDGFHKLIIMGITASVGLTMFLFQVIEWPAIVALQEDVTIIREDVGYIKGIIEAWNEELYLTRP